MKKTLLAVLCIAAAGCSTQGQVDPDVMQIATTPLTCSTKAECELWWQRAQTWVTSHSKYAIEASTDTLIQTAGPDGGRSALAYQITRAANPDGTTTIGFAAHCDGALGCTPNPWEAGADFKQYVRGAAAGVPLNGTKPAQPAPSTMQPEASQGESAPATNDEAVAQ